MAILVRLRTAYARIDTRVFAALGLAAVFVALWGIYWDVTWHSTIGRDSFWILPHLLVYSGVGLSLLSALGGLALAWQRASSLRAALSDRGG